MTAKEYREQFGQKTSKRKNEETVHNQVCKYLDLQYPNVLYLTDLSGIRLTIGQAKKAKKQRCKTFKIPDLIILHPNQQYHGLILEIKKDIDQIMKKDGSIRQSEHIQSQKKSLQHLEDLGYKSLFGCGFEHCKNVIDEYLSTVNLVIT